MGSGLGSLLTQGRFWLLYLLSISGTLGVLGFFFVKSKPLFVASVFFAVLLLLIPLLVVQRNLLGFSFPGVDFIPSFIVFFILIAIFPKFRNHITWLEKGKGSKLVWILLSATMGMTAGALVAWRFLAHPDLANLEGMMPPWSPPLLILGGFGFAVSNAFAEEVVFRGMIRDGILSYAPIPAELLVTSGLFAAAHLNGFPRGVWGVGMAFVWGFMQGVIRTRSKGILFPLLTHAAADLVIFALLLVTR